MADLAQWAEKENNRHLEEIAGVNETPEVKEIDPDYEYELDIENNL